MTLSPIFIIWSLTGVSHTRRRFPCPHIATIPPPQASLVKRNFKVVIADECHYLKNPRAARTKALVPIIKNAIVAILISGTPALSRPIELYTQLHALVPGTWDSEKDFIKRYCKPKKEKAANGTGGERKRYGAEKKGASNTGELHIVLSGSIMIRRLKKDILQQLPKKVRRIVKVEVRPNACATTHRRMRHTLACCCLLRTRCERKHPVRRRPSGRSTPTGRCVTDVHPIRMCRCRTPMWRRTSASAS